MQLKPLGYLMTALTLFTLGATAQAAPKASPKAAIVKMASPEAVVIVKLGSAMQEEYTGGDPSERSTTYLSGETAQKPATSKTATKPEG